MVIATQGHKVARFAERSVRLFEGSWAGQPFILEPFQRDIIDEVFRVDANGKRIWRRVLLGLPRKNAKSHLAALLALYLLIADGENAPQVILASGAREQAKEILYRQARTFVETSPWLGDFIDVQDKRLFCASNNGLIRAISAEGRSAHGLNPYAVIVDEFHTFSSPKQRELWAALNTGSLARDEQMLIAITTAGYDKATPLGEFYDLMMAAPEIETHPGCTIARNYDAGELMIWFAAPDGCDIDDEESWRQANPAPWIRIDDLRSERHSSAVNEADFRRLYLNQWTSAHGSWLTHGEWNGCKADVTWENGEPVWLALDLASKHDRTAISLVGKTETGLKTEAFVFEAGESATEMIVRAKLKLVDLMRTYQVREIAFDPWRIDINTVEAWSNEGLPLVEFPQSDARMCPATQALYTLVKEGRLAHDGDPVLASHIAAAVAVQTERGWRLTKRKSTQPVDACIATVMAVSRALAPDDTQEFWIL